MGVWTLSVKIVTASAAVFTSAMALRLVTPPLTEFLLAEGPRLYKSIAAWLTPPYLYFIINGIIISIAATSRFQKTSAPLLSASAEPEFAAPNEYVAKVGEDASLSPEFLSSGFGGGEDMEVSDSAAKMDLDEGFVIARSSWSPKRREKSAAGGVGGDVADKPPVSTRLGRRKSIKASPEGKALRVARPRKQETLESTWRTITDGRPVPLARHLKKADTWNTHIRAATTEPSLPSAPAMRKSESVAFAPSTTDGLTSPASSSHASPLPAGRIRREPSLGQDDLNRRVEAFIKKFNEDMRLQRQQSLQQYMDMLNSSGH